jgi:stage V sporulation protein B
MSKRESRDNFLIQGTILGVASIVVRLIGVLYRVPLTGIIGDMGNGYYSSAYNIYAMILLISSYSIPLAVSRILSERLARKEYKNAHRIMIGAMIYAVIVGSIGALVAYFFAPYIIPSNMSRGALALKVLAPTIFFSAILGVFRGYFQGHNTMVPTSVSQIYEQIINAVGSVAAAYIFTKTVAGDSLLVAERGAAGGAVGTGLGVITALVYLIFCYCRQRGRIHNQYDAEDATVKVESYGSIIKLIFLTVTPVIFSSFIFNVNSTIDQYLYSFIMGIKGFSEEAITGWYGVYGTKYLVIIGVPVALAAAISTAVVPSIVLTLEDHDRKRTYEKIDLTILYTMLISIPCAVGMGVLAKPILCVLFGTGVDLAAELLSWGAITIIFTALSTVTNSVLQGIGKLHEPVKNAAISLVVHCIFVVAILLITDWNLHGLVLGTLVFGVVMCFLNERSLVRAIQYHQNLKTTMILPFVASLIMGVFTYLSYNIIAIILPENRIGFTIGICFSVLISVVVYAFALVRFRVLNEEILVEMPMGTRIVKVFKKCKLL